MFGSASIFYVLIFNACLFANILCLGNEILEMCALLSRSSRIGIGLPFSLRPAEFKPYAAYFRDSFLLGRSIAADQSFCTR